VERALAVAAAVGVGVVGGHVRGVERVELGHLLDALGRMTTNLSTIVREVRQSSESIATGASQIASGNADLSVRTEQQASNLQQTAAAMEQIGATVKSNADTAVEATSMAGQASAAAGRGGEIVGEVVHTMGAISAASQRVVDIIGVIDGIAFQTNILALNAAVEAARAGEQGRGFAVVAKEVRALATRSAGAAREIKTLIVDSVEKIQAGAGQATDAGAAMNDIVNRVQRVNTLMDEISQASRQQAQGVGEVSGAVGQLDAVTQQNAALVEESAAAAESLNQQAVRLVDLVRVFHNVSADARA
jgi:methyl-accepting chemotaxis protein